MEDAYVAGIIDADGSIILSRTKRDRVKKSPYYHVTVQVTNTCKEVLDMLVEEYGGSVCTKPMSVGSFFTRREHYNWAISGKGAISLLERLQKYFIIKKEQANTCQRFWRERTVRMGNSRVPDAELALRESFYQKMKGLNASPQTD